MKRPLLATLIIGIFVVVGVRALHLSQQLVQFEDRAVNYVSSWDAATRIVSKPAQYAILSILAFGVAALTLSSLRRGRIGLLAAGRSREEILKAYPYLEAEDIEQALAYAAWRLEERELSLGVE